MRAIIFRPDRNVIKHDYTGAFKPESDRFKKYFGDQAFYEIDVSKSMAARRTQVRQILLHHTNVDVFAFFCHGLQSQIQLGFDRVHVRSLAQAIYESSSGGSWAVPGPVVALYACSNGGGPGIGGDGGFADLLRDELCRAGDMHCHVIAHTKKGHVTWNPYVRVFDGNGSYVGAQGGQWIVAPPTDANIKKGVRSSDLWRKWVRALNPPKGVTNTWLRLRFPTMTVAEIHAELLRVEISAELLRVAR